MVRVEGLEPPLPYGNQILSLARLPIPPHPRMCALAGRRHDNQDEAFGKQPGRGAFVPDRTAAQHVVHRADATLTTVLDALQNLLAFFCSPRGPSSV